MAWWRTGKDDDVAGDMPADVVAKALEQHLEQGGSTMSFGALLRAWSDALNAEPRALVADADATAYRLSARIAGDDRRALQSAPGPSALPQRTIALEALRRIAGAYRDASNRLPRRSELAYTLEFSLGSAATEGRFGEGPFELAEIAIEPLGAAPAP